MKILEGLVGLGFVPLAKAIWTKCSQQCDGGTQINVDGITRGCNLESCEAFTNNLLTDSDMELPEADLPWGPAGGVVVTKITDGYFGEGYHVSNRNQRWKTIAQTVSCSSFTQVRIFCCIIYTRLTHQHQQDLL